MIMKGEEGKEKFNKMVMMRFPFIIIFFLLAPQPLTFLSWYIFFQVFHTMKTLLVSSENSSFMKRRKVVRKKNDFRKDEQKNLSKVTLGFHLFGQVLYQLSLYSISPKRERERKNIYQRDSRRGEREDIRIKQTVILNLSGMEKMLVYRQQNYKMKKFS